MNEILRDQLDQAHVINQKLSDDLKRSTNELQQVRDEFNQRSREWKEEERVSRSTHRLDQIRWIFSSRFLINITTKNII